MHSPPPGFSPALIIVDFQEDFCPPFGALAVPSARSTFPPINHLLTLPFRLKLATQDWHPPAHISFARNHAHNPAPFTDSTIITHPADPTTTYTTTLWPVHCVVGTPGAALVEELNVHHLDGTIKKGQDPRVEMYSAFCDPFRWTPAGAVCVSGLEERLKEKGVRDVFVAGLATDYCVRATAEDAVRLGFRVWVVREGCAAVGGEEGGRAAEVEMEKAGVKVVGIGGLEVGWVSGEGVGAL